MKRSLFCFGIFVSLFFLSSTLIAQPTVEQFKQQFYTQMQKLKPSDVTRRNVSFVEVVKGSPSGAYYPFKVTAYVHDYSPGYPANHYYGKTCVQKFDGLKYDMLKDNFGGWNIQGKFTASLDDTKCANNPSQGLEALPLSSVQGTVYNATQIKQASPNATLQKPAANKNGDLYVGEYACYGTGSRLMAGMGFILKPNGTYVDVDNKRGGTYNYNSQKATISFNGGFLSGQVGKNVKQSGFQLSNTVTAEPWR
jgi:hypothetical protein